MTNEKRKRLRLPVIPKHYQHFGVSVIFIVFLPLLPLFLEYWFLSKISAQSLTLATAIYAVSIGASSTHTIIFGLAIPVSIAFSAAFGVVISIESPPPGCSYAAAISIIVISVIHVGERWNRHAVDKKPFWSF